MSCPCGLTQEKLISFGWVDKQRCTALYEMESGDELVCGKLFTSHPVEAKVWNVGTGAESRGVSIDLDDALVEIRQRLKALQISHKPAGISTAAEWVASLKEAGSLFAASQSFESFLIGGAVTWWPTPNVQPFPEVGSSETTTCQPFVTQRLKEVVSCEGNVHRKKVVRNLWCSPYVQETHRVIFESIPVDGHSTISFATRRPDIVLYHGERRVGCAITAIGDVRGCGSRNRDFPAEEIGHVLDMSKDLMTKEQFTRAYVYCFLTDGYRFQFFKCTRVQRGENFMYEQSPVYGGERGWQIFFGLLVRPVEELGFSRLEIPNWQMISGLGCGRFSSVFSVRQMNTANKICAVKVFREAHMAMAEAEKAILERLHSASVGNIPIVEDIFIEETFSALVVSPVGNPVLPCGACEDITPAMMQTLLNVVRQTHRVGLIHRDIKPDNIFLDSNNSTRIILSDWSSAAPTGVETSYVGTPLFGDPPGLFNRHVPTPSLDLRSLVRTAFCLSKQRLPPVDNNHTEAAQYWREIASNYSQFKRALDLASEANYDELAILLGTLW